MNVDDTTALPLEAVQHAGLRWRDGATVAVDEAIAAEVPVALVYNGISHVVMLATPLDLESFAVGFSLSEGIVHSAAEVHDVEAVVVPEGIEVRMTIASERFIDLKERRRNLAGRTGCGLCGTESLQHAIRSLQQLSDGPRVDPAALHRAFASLPGYQQLFERTGAVHAAGWACLDGSLVLVRAAVEASVMIDVMVSTPYERMEVCARRRSARSLAGRCGSDFGACFQVKAVAALTRVVLFQR